METKQVAGSVFGAALKVIIVVFLVFFVFRGATIAYDYGYRVFAEPPMAQAGDGRIVSVAIAEGKSVKEVGAILEAKGLIRDPQLFYLQYITSKYNKKEIVAGAYELSTEMTTEELLGTITAQVEKEE